MWNLHRQLFRIGFVEARRLPETLVVSALVKPTGTKPKEVSEIPEPRQKGRDSRMSERAKTLEISRFYGAYHRVYLLVVDQFVF